MQSKRIISRIWGLLTPIIVYVTISLVVQLVAVMMSVSLYEYATEVTALGAVVSFPFLAWMMKRDKKKTPAEVQRDGLSIWRGYIWWILGACLYVIFMNLFLMVSGIMNISKAYQEVAELIYTPSFSVQLLCVGILVPVAEELVFRGLIYRRLRRYSKILPAILISAFLFGIYHGNVVQFIYAFFAGIGLAFVYEKKKSIFAPIILHVVMNITSCVATEFGWFGWILEW